MLQRPEDPTPIKGEFAEFGRSSRNSVAEFQACGLFRVRTVRFRNLAFLLLLLVFLPVLLLF